jgi:transcriptional regulator with XRE-family HTH domain
MARAALQISVRDLAATAEVSPTTITRLERGESLYSRTVEVIRTALEAAGVEFIPENGGGAGVRLRKDIPDTRPMSAQADPDDAPELTSAFFDQAQISEGGQIIRQGRDRRANR